MSSGATHWCYECRRPIVLDGRDVVCPHCNEGFVQELNEMQGFAPQHTFSSHPGEFHQMPDIFDALHAFMGRRGSEPRFGFMDAMDNFMRQRMAGRHPNFDVRGRSGLVPVPEQSWGVFSSGPYLIFQSQVPGFTLSNGSPRGGPRRVDFGDYFMGPGLEELIEQLTMNERRGLAPAARSSIDAMPTIKITHAHLRFPGNAQGIRFGGKAAPAEAAPAKADVPAADDDDDLDLFGDETEEDKKAAEEREAAKKPAKNKESGKSSVLLDVKPWDDETDMKKLEEAVRSVEMPGLLWGASKLVPVGYGIKKLQIMMTIVDDLVSVDSLIEEHLTAEPCSEYIQSCDIVAFNKI